MANAPIRLLQVSTSDIGGGAEKVAWDLFQNYRARGIESWMVVGSKLSNDPDILLLPMISNADTSNWWVRRWLTVANKFSSLDGRVRGAWKVRNLLRLIAQPKLLLDSLRGYEDFNFQGSWYILDLLDERPDILHCHNLHGSYFDLRALPWLSQQIPVVLTLHDAWLLSGHCAHSFGCERWESGCGKCPDLTIPPAIKHDATADNWLRKKDIYSRSRLFVTAPSQWLMGKVERSILASAIVESKVIPNGVDLSVFNPDGQREARADLRIPQDARVLLFVGSATRNNLWKDYPTLETVVKQVAERLPDERILLVCLGEEQPPQRVGKAEVQFIGFQNRPADVARFYKSADLYVHATKADTFPNTVLEALACGVPVVATSVGGLPEQVMDGETGFLVPPKDPETMTDRVVSLLVNKTLNRQFALNAAQDARNRFDLKRQVDAYIAWYQSIMEGGLVKHE